MLCNIARRLGAITNELHRLKGLCRLHRGPRSVTLSLFGMRINLGQLFLREQKTEKVFLSPPQLPKELGERTCSQNRAVTRDICKGYEPGALGVGGAGGGGSESSPLCVPLSPSKYLFTKHQLSHLYVNYPLLCSPKPILSTSSFVFSQRQYLR